MTRKHVLIECVDTADIRKQFFNCPDLKTLFNSVAGDTILITDEGSVPEMRIWSISLIKSDQNGVYILVEVSLYISFFGRSEFKK